MTILILQFALALFLFVFSKEILKKLIPKMLLFLYNDKNKDYTYAIIISTFIFFNIIFFKTPMKIFIKNEALIVGLKILYLFISVICIYIFKIKMQKKYYLYDYKFQIQNESKKPYELISNLATIEINEEKTKILNKISVEKVIFKPSKTNQKKTKIEISEEWKETIYYSLRKNNIINDNMDLNEFKIKFLTELISLKMECKVLFYFHKCFDLNVKTSNKITLKDFIQYFTDEKDCKFLYESVKNGSDYLIKNTDVIDNLKIFKKKPMT